MSKTWRLVKIAEPLFREMGLAVDILDLSRLTSEFGKQIHPCKSCVSTSMALCHWPCSCYPNYSLGQTDDWMNEIYPLWVAAHGIMIVTPVNWYHAAAGLKAMIDRLVCADGGNPDPSSTHGKRPEEAKALELKGWPYGMADVAGRADSGLTGSAFHF
jgi:multimeric flavodoxin WrbA